MADQPEVDDGEAVRPYGTILGKEIDSGTHELEREAGGLLLSGLSAGLDLGFSIFLIGVLQTLLQDVLPHGVLRVLTGNAYAVGFILVVMGRSELFTEHTTRAVFPVLAGRAGLSQLARLWGLVYGANLVGAAASALFIANVGPALGAIEPAALGEHALKEVSYGALTILLSAALAGWLMGLLSWLVSASRDTIGQIVIIWLVTMVIGVGGLHHSIVGTVSALAAIFAGEPLTWAHFGHFLLWTTLGNAIGGVIFVAVLKYGHASRERPKARRS